MFKKTIFALCLVVLWPATVRAETGLREIVFAGGCFWGVEAVFENVKGVQEAVSGYAGGRAEDARYDVVSRGNSGHAEAVKVVYDPAQVTLADLLDVYFKVAHDPTQLNRQGPDTGTQYRSEVFVETDADGETVRQYIADLDAAKAYPDPVVTKVSTLAAFFPAEPYHQDYMARNPFQPYIVMHDRPKLAHLRRAFPSLCKPQ